MEKTFNEVREAFENFCGTVECSICPLNEFEEGCTDLLIVAPEKVFEVIFPSFGEKILKEFPGFKFDKTCVDSFFRGRKVKKGLCNHYTSCYEHYMTSTEEDILKQLEWSDIE